MAKIAILGAGMLGTCLALEMAHRKIKVDLYDRASQCMTQAGQRNEGKIHLGFVYGADLSCKTADKMIHGAMSFYPLLRKWIGAEIDTVCTSTPFIYAVTHDSLLSLEKCERHFSNIEQKLLGYDPINYPGGLLPKVEKLSKIELQKNFNPAIIQGAYRTCEKAIDVRQLAKILQKKLESSPTITFYPHSTIEKIDRKKGRWEIEYTTTSQRENKEYDIVINALWDGRIGIDQQVGLYETSSWSYRLKHAIFLRCSVPIDVPSTTIIQGPYGDLVNFGQGCYYLSWYPKCMQGFVKNKIAPPPWNLNLSRSEAKQLITETVANLSEHIPLVGTINEQNIQEFSVLGGIIYARGDTDVDDPQSGLHRRYELDIKKNENYYSIDPGKYSLCPFFADQAAHQIHSEQLLSTTFV